MDAARADKLEPFSERRSFYSLDIRQAARPMENSGMSRLEALRSWRYAVRRGQPRSAVKLVLTTCACIAAMLLVVVPLLTFEADARGGGGGGHGGGGHGGGG